MSHKFCFIVSFKIINIQFIEIEKNKQVNVMYVCIISKVKY